MPGAWHATKQVAPYFAIAMVFFLMAFVGYFVITIIALVLDFEGTLLVHLALMRAFCCLHQLLPSFRTLLRTCNFCMLHAHTHTNAQTHTHGHARTHTLGICIVLSFASEERIHHCIKGAH